jgi:hypothetical protein
LPDPFLFSAQKKLPKFTKTNNNMKKIIQLAVILMAILPGACFGQVKKAAWPQMKTFHSFMAATFHPAEEGNLAPLKAKADSLLMAAVLWQKAAIPSNYKPAETRAALIKLVDQCTKVKNGVEAKMGDEDLKKMIAEAHEIFHHIAGECKNADE